MYAKPLPAITREDRPFWAAAREHRFVLPRCGACSHVFFPPYLSFERDWIPASGRATVWGYTIMRQPYLPGWRDELPYNVVLVQLEEGPMMYSNLVGVPLDQIRPDLPVRAVFEDATDEITLIKFQLDPERASRS